jgi:hypothetical protein
MRKVSEELEAWTSGIQMSLPADDGQPPPAGFFRFASPERGRERPKSGGQDVRAPYRFDWSSLSAKDLEH